MTFVPGTESTHAEDLAKAEFGPSTLVPILLTGPQRQLDRQGPVLVHELTSREDVRVLSAWDAGEAGAALHPSRTEAMIVASVARSEEEMVDHVQSDLNGVVDAHVSAPVRAHITGQPTLDQAIQDEALHTARVATLLALPLLFLALLLVLRAPVAALITTAFGGVTAFVGFGVMTLVAEQFDDRCHRSRTRIGDGARARNRTVTHDPHSVPQRGGRPDGFVPSRPRSPPRPRSAAPAARF